MSAHHNVMNDSIRCRCLAVAALALACVPSPAAEPEIAAVTAAAKAHVDRHEVAGAITCVAGAERLLHLSAVGQADIAGNVPMRTDALFWIASMTKPVTAAAVLMLQDEGKLSVDDPVAKHLPELAALKTADGKTPAVTLTHLLTHTSGMGEATGEQRLAARSLADLIPHYAAQPLRFEPGARWEYCQSSINTLARVVEVVSGRSFPDFLKERLFDPLGMKDTTFYPTAAQLARLAKSYKLVDGRLEEASIYPDYDPRRAGRYPAANGGLFSTAGDYVRFCQMLLGQGAYGGKRYLSRQAVARMATIQTGEIVTGFTGGNGWGLGCCVVRTPQGPTAALSPGSFGHGGAYGTQAWIDPVKKVAYVLMVQRANFPNADASDLRRDFQGAAAAAL